LAKAYYPNGGSFKEWTPDMVGALGSKNANGYQGMTRPDGSDNDWIRTTKQGIIPYSSSTDSALGTSGWKFREAWIQTINGFLNGTATNANVLNHKESYQEKSTANVMYYQLGSIKCTHAYQRVNETYLCVSRQNACIMNLSMYSNNDTIFTNPTVSYTFLTPNAKAAFYDIFYAGLDKKATAGNTFSIWAKRGQWQESMRLIPLGANYDAGYVISWKSWDATTAGSTSVPTFGEPAAYKLIVTPHSHAKSEVGLGNVDNTADSAKSVKYATTAGSANAVAWGNVSGKPSTYAPSSHTHDDRYYTESEMNTKLNAKAESDVVTISSTKPTSNTCKLWIKI
jgi:hypothetical protein